MAQYELSPVLAKYLDRHLVFPLLEFLHDKSVYDEQDILKAKIELLQKTNMVDFAMDMYKALYNTEDVPADMRDRRSEVVAKLRSIQADVEPIIGVLTNERVQKNIRQDNSFNLQYLAEEFQIGPEHIDALYHYAKFQFDCGNYSAAAELLSPYQSLCTSTERSVSAVWGKLAANILMQNFDEAQQDLVKLRDHVEHMATSPLMQLQQRTWLMHWSLYVFWNHENGRNALIDLFFHAPYLQAIQINAQHLLRYLATAVLVVKGRRTSLKDLKELIRVIQQESYQYSDPITDFLECLFVKYDFEGAQAKLKLCEEVLDNDFFLSACKEEFMENARMHIFETYCRIHQCIDIKMLADRLNMDVDAAEKWIANLILNARLHAKIDSQAGTVVMGVQSQSVHDQLVEKARGLSVRTFHLANAVVGAAAKA